MINIKNRTQLISNICLGNCYGKLGFLVKAMGGLQPNEIDQILYSWQTLGFIELLELYSDALKDNDLFALLNVDALLNEENLEETNGRS